MQVTIFYFTGTGNTKYVSDYLSECLNKSSINAVSLSISQLKNLNTEEIINNSDIIFLAYPTYGSDMPDNMKKFIHALPEENGKKLGVICTQLLFSGDGASIYFSKIKKLGYNQKWAYQINMPNNLCISGSPFVQSDDYKYHEEKHLAKARKKIESLCISIVQDKKEVKDHTILHWFLAMSQRPWYRLFVAKKYKYSLAVNQDKCVKCGLCVQACPNDVILMNSDKVYFGNQEDCTICLRCLNFCPYSAILFNGKIKEPFYKGPTKEIYQQLFINRDK